MKQVMEGWRHYLKEIGDMEPCPETPYSLGHLKDALDILASDPDVAQKKINNLKKTRGRFAGAEKLLTVVAPVLDIAGGGGAITLGAGVVGLIAAVSRAKQEGKVNNKVQELMKMLCIDDNLLDLVDNNIETKYWADSGVRAHVDEYLNAANQNTPLPNFTTHFVEWLNKTYPGYAVNTPGTPNTDIVQR